MVESAQNENKINALIASIVPKALLEPFETLCGITMTRVDNGEEAIQFLSTNRYDLLIADYTLPDIDIWRLVTLIRSGQYCREDFPVLMLRDFSDPAIPAFLSSDYGFSSLAVDELSKAPDVIAALLQHKNTQPRVLIIEDDADAANIAKCALQGMYNVQIETSGNGGIDAWRKDAHDIVVLDLLLPGLHGRSVLDEIISINPDQPVIVVTAYGEQERHMDYVLNGASEFLSKPYTITALRDACRNATIQSKWMNMTGYTQRLLSETMKYISATNLSLQSGNVDSAEGFMRDLMNGMKAYQPTDDELVEFMSGYRSR